MANPDATEEQQAAPEDGKAQEAPPKKQRGKPKDPEAPPKPQSGYQKFTGEARGKLKEERPELVSDLSAMGKALAEEWQKVPQEEKDRLQKIYEEEMKIWKPKWAAYKETDHYKEFFEIKSDWMDVRARKKLQKKMTTDAPKRPRSGYMIFGGEVRERISEAVKAEGLGMGEIGKRISEEWQALGEDKKAKYAEQAAAQKADFDIKFLDYRKGESFKNYMDAKATLEGGQAIKKITRVTFREAPKKAPSAYALYRSEVMPGIVEENDKRADGEKMAMGDMTKKISSMWGEVPEEKKKPYMDKADELKKEYERQLKEFRSKGEYTAFLEKRAKIKARQNIQLNLRDLPKRPKSVFGLFAEEHKNEVPKGKGEGKGQHALKTLWGEQDEEVKKKYASKEAELREKWKADVEEFKTTERYKTFEVTKKKVMVELQTEAAKTTTLRFLSEAPTPPPKSPFALYLVEKRKKADDAGEEPPSKQAKKEEVKAAKDGWLKFDPTVRKEYDDKRKEQLKEYEGQVKEFMATPKWQEYTKEAKRLKVPVKSLLFHKKKIMKKLKPGEKPGPSSIPLPTKPEEFPQKGKKASKIFFNEKRKEMDSPAEIMELWIKLPQEEKKKYEEMAQEQAQEYTKQMLEFKKSDAGKDYFKGLKSALRRRKLLGARLKFLQEIPKKPLAAVVAYMKEKVPEVKKENPGAKGFDIRRILTEKWQALSADEKKPYEDAAREKFEEFDKAMKEFKAGDNWKGFVRATMVRRMGVKKKPKAKGKSKGIPLPAKPEGFPVKPNNAFHQFCKEQAGNGKQLGQLAKDFQELPTEEKQRRKDEAEQKSKEYEEALDAFNKSEAGRKYNKMTALITRKNKLMEAKAKFLKNEPKKPPAAYMMFAAEMRPKIQADNPELKGIGPVGVKVGQEWSKLEPDEKAKWNDKYSEGMKEYNEKMEEFRKTPEHKKYEAIVNKLTGKSKAPKAKGKGKSAPKIMLPTKPDNLPQKPMSGFAIFAKEKRAEGKISGLKEINEAWIALGADGQKEFNEKYQQELKNYEKEMKEFTKSAEGKRYLREKAGQEKKMRIAKAKSRFLGGGNAPAEPKRPPSSYFIFVSEKRSEVPAEPGAKIGDVAKKISVMWNDLPADEKKTYEDKAEELKKKYDEEMATYKNSKEVKAYSKALGNITGKKAKKAAAKMVAAKGRGAAAKGRGGAGRGRGRGAKPAAKGKKNDSDSDSDVMGSDSDSSSSSSDSD